MGTRHLVFYDGECGLCDQAVQFILKADTAALFAFAPLQGETAAHYIAHLPAHLKNVDSLILVENYKSNAPKTFVLAQGALRIAWLLGGVWKLVGWLSFLPSFLFDWIYQLVAKNRYRLFGQACMVPPPNQRDRFLP
jgi:predicted DCC family thiol-disulfide oxidoreductase YuxK